MPLQPMVTGARHMIAAGHYLAAQAGHTVLEAGGNAVDAGVAAGLALGVVPAAPDAFILALDRYGTMSFGDVAGAAIRYAREGFTVHPVMAHYIAKNEATYRRWPSNEAIFLSRGRPPREGELFVQTDLARSLQFMADQERAASRGGRVAGLHAARDAFYRGDLAIA